MSMQAEIPAVIPSAQVIGNAFVEQYYQILHQTPELVYRFYQDSSVLSRPDPNGVMACVMTMQGINEKITSLNYKDYIAEIKTADAQLSLGEGVTVLVTGYLIGKDEVRKKFVQSFFLAPQEKGFFVLNDVFRYVDDESSEAAPVSVSGVSENAQAAAPPQEPEQPSQAPDHPAEACEPSFEENPTIETEVRDPSENEDLSITEEEIVEAPVELKPSEAANVTPVPSVSQDDAPKKSYASILKAMNTNPSPVRAKAPASHIKSNAPSANQEAVGSSKPGPAIQVSASTSKSGPEKNKVVEEVDDYSIYVRNLPQSATPAQLEDIFKKFGPVKQGGIQVRSNKQGFCFGFVEFESSSSMRSAIEASPIVIGNCKAAIEEKKTTTRVSGVVDTNSGRGRYAQSSRGGFRNDSFRGRGNFGGGRGYGRGDYRSQGDYSSRPRGSAGVNQNGGRHGEQPQ